MRRTLSIVAIAVVVLAGVVKLVAAPSRTVAGTDPAIQPTISTLDMHLRYPGMKTLPVAEIPLP